jgi:hypothetical protein
MMEVVVVASVLGWKELEIGWGRIENRGRGGTPRPRHWESNPDSNPGNRPLHEMGLFVGCGFLTLG